MIFFVFYDYLCIYLGQNIPPSPMSGFVISAVCIGTNGTIFFLQDMSQLGKEIGNLFYHAADGRLFYPDG